MSFYAYETAVIDEGACIGDGTKIWHSAHICGTARVGQECNIGQNVFVDHGAVVGNRCKLQNNVNVYKGVTLEDHVFCGPSMTFTNVKTPRCKYPAHSDHYLKTLVREGASIGAQAVVVCGVVIGKNAMIGSGAVITRDVPDHALMVGNPARQIGWVCECGRVLEENGRFVCPSCGREYRNTDSGLEPV